MERKLSNFNSNFTEFFKGMIDGKSTLVAAVAWCQIGDKPLPEPMVTQLIVTYMSPQNSRIYLISPWTKWLHFADDIFRCIFMNEKFCILIKISMKFVPGGPIGNDPALV